MRSPRWLSILILTALVGAATISPAATNARLAALDEDAAADGRITILLVGADAGPQREGIRTDTMIVVSVEQETGRAAIFGVPRNIVMAPLPEETAGLFECRCWPSLLNELYGYAEANPALFPGIDHPGGYALKGAIGNMLGLRIDYFALVDLPGFVDVVDALGGVTIDVPVAIRIFLSPAKEGEDWVQYDIEPGRQHLDGRQALAYVRSREDESDYERMTRQRCLLGALAKGADIPNLLRRYPKLVSKLKDSVVTDVPRDDLSDLIELAGEVDTGQVIALGFDPPAYTAGWVDPGYPIPDPAQMQQTVQAIFTQPLDTATQTYGTLPTTCGWSGDS